MKRMSNKKVLEEIRDWLHWDYDREEWKDPMKDPEWDALDLLCAIEELLEVNGFGNPRSKRKKKK